MRSALRPSLALIALLSFALPGHSQENGRPIEIVDVRIGLSEHLKQGCWAPVALDIATRGVGFQGSVELTAPDSNGVPATTILGNVVIPPDSQSTLHGLYHADSTTDLSILLRDQKGAEFSPTICRRRTRLRRAACRSTRLSSLASGPLRASLSSVMKPPNPIPISPTVSTASQ